MVLVVAKRCSYKKRTLSCLTFTHSFMLMIWLHLLLFCAFDEFESQDIRSSYCLIQEDRRTFITI
jgi:hypothetical protein